MSEIKIFQMNDCDWWAADSLESAIQDCMEQYGYTREQVEEDEPRELTDEELDSLQYTDDPSDSEAETRTFREQLKVMQQEPEKYTPHPCLFASTEY